MLNFMVTEEGLLDQMQNIIVEIEDKPKFDRNNANIQQKAANEKVVEELQDKILDQIANSQGDLLDDVELVKALDESKVKVDAIEQSNRELEVTAQQIESLRNTYQPVALRVSRLFFVLSELM